MRERNEFILMDLISIRAEQKPDLDVLTFEHTASTVVPLLMKSAPTPTCSAMPTGWLPACKPAVCKKATASP